MVDYQRIVKEMVLWKTLNESAKTAAVKRFTRFKFEQKMAALQRLVKLPA